MKLSAQRCFLHASREAVALCPECRHYFCRECVSEHSGRVLCAKCLDAQASVVAKKSVWRDSLLQLLLLVFGLFLGWAWFYYLGSFFLFLPSSFHEGTLWH